MIILIITKRSERHKHTHAHSLSYGHIASASASIFNISISVCVCNIPSATNLHTRWKRRRRKTHTIWCISKLIFSAQNLNKTEKEMWIVKKTAKLWSIFFLWCCGASLFIVTNIFSWLWQFTVWPFCFSHWNDIQMDDLRGISYGFFASCALLERLFVWVTLYQF